ncbi:MAG: hypothetical protein ACPGWR_04035 [Ardenticatenaceae bacterium]
MVGEAGILIDPTDADALADAMQHLLVAPEQTAYLRQQGYRQAARFSWDRCAQETLGVYREVGGREK